MKSLWVLASLALTLLSSFGPAQAAERSRLLTNTTGKTVIRKVALGNDMTVAIISKAGTAVIADPTYAPEGAVPDFIVVTHDHHVNKAYLDGKKSVPMLVQKSGAQKVGDIKVTGVASAHGPDDTINKDAPSIVTYLFEVDGLRIAYFACNGQRKLFPEQQAALGKVDVALITAENEGSVLSVERARDLMKQLNARVVVPLSHNIGDSEYHLEQMAELAGGKLETVHGELLLRPEDAKGAGQRVVSILATLAP